MRVAVIELRDEKGRKRPRDAVRNETPLFGYLQFEGTCYLQEHQDAPPTVGALLPVLANASVRRIRKGGMVVVGGYLDPNDRGPSPRLIPQAWWVRPVGHGGIPYVEEPFHSAMPPGSYR
jgi:hypothetical protein